MALFWCLLLLRWESTPRSNFLISGINLAMDSKKVGLSTFKRRRKLNLSS